MQFYTRVGAFSGKDPSGVCYGFNSKIKIIAISYVSGKNVREAILKKRPCVKLVTKKARRLFPGESCRAAWSGSGAGFDANDASTHTNALPLCPAHSSDRKQKVAKLVRNSFCDCSCGRKGHLKWRREEGAFPNPSHVHAGRRRAGPIALPPEHTKHKKNNAPGLPPLAVTQAAGQ